MSGIAATPDGTIVPVPGAPAPEIDDAPDGGAPPPIAEEEDDRRRRRRWFLLLLLLIGLAILIFLAIWYFLFRQPIPLPLPNTIVMPSYATSMYGATGPMGIASTQDGSRIYVAQTGGERVVAIFDGVGNRLGSATPPADAGAEFVPVWLALDPITSELYVSDRPTGEIFVYDGDGAYLRTFTPVEPIPGWQPMGVAFDASGNLYVVDLAGVSPRVEMFDRSGNLVRAFGEADRLSFPNGVAVDAKGNVFVADSDNGRLMAYRPDGTLLAQVGRGQEAGKLGMPRGIGIDGGGRIYIVDNTAQGVAVMQLKDGPVPAIESLGAFGGPGIEDGRFAFPNGIAADGRGRLYVTDTTNDRIQLWSY